MMMNPMGRAFASQSLISKGKDEIQLELGVQRKTLTVAPYRSKMEMIQMLAIASCGADGTGDQPEEPEEPSPKDFSEEMSPQSPLSFVLDS
jgi:hypothetical protein